MRARSTHCRWICKHRIFFALIIIYYYWVTPRSVLSFRLMHGSLTPFFVTSCKNFWIMFVLCKTWIMHVNRVVFELRMRIWHFHYPIHSLYRDLSMRFSVWYERCVWALIFPFSFTDFFQLHNSNHYNRNWEWSIRAHGFIQRGHFELNIYTYNS